MEYDSVPMSDHPAADKIVIINVQGSYPAEEPVLIHESLLKSWRLDDRGPIESCATRDHEDPAVNVVTSGAFEVVSLEV
jgi:hypothetical protein